jgi:regulator of sirC expression with transglutaminase-like and TPR domain
MYVDPFFGGQALTQAEAYARIEQSTGQSIASAGEALKRATHRQWLARMLNNLQAAFATAGRERDLFAMQELQQLVL